MSSKGRCFRDRRRTARRQERQRAAFAWFQRKFDYSSLGSSDQKIEAVVLLRWHQLSELAKQHITVAYNKAGRPTAPTAYRPWRAREARLAHVDQG